MTLTLAGFAIAILGAGEWSLDHALEIFDPPGTDGLLIALVAGAGGAAGLLAGFWRPEKKPEP
jgi:putative oxidoreductase